MLAYSIAVTFRSVNEDDAFLDSVTLVDIIHPSSRAANETEFDAQVKHFFIHQELGADHHTFIVGKDRISFVRFDSRLVIAMVAEGFSLFDEDGMYIVDYEDVHIIGANISICFSSC